MRLFENAKYNFLTGNDLETKWHNLQNKMPKRRILTKFIKKNTPK
jgi:hypothetical protein